MEGEVRLGAIDGSIERVLRVRNEPPAFVSFLDLRISSAIEASALTPTRDPAPGVIEPVIEHVGVRLRIIVPPSTHCDGEFWRAVHGPGSNP